MDSEKKREEYKKYLERRISIMQEEVDYLRGRLKALERGEELSDSEDDTLEGARVYDSTDSD
jgi:exonuclease VII small subunit